MILFACAARAQAPSGSLSTNPFFRFGFLETNIRFSRKIDAGVLFEFTDIRRPDFIAPLLGAGANKYRVTLYVKYRFPRMKGETFPVAF